MSASLANLVDVRGWLAESVLAYLAWVRRLEVELPRYFPPRLRDQAGAFEAIWQRLLVRSRPAQEDGRGEAGPWAGGGDDGPPGTYAPRRRHDDNRPLHEPLVVTWDEETAARWARAVILGDPGAGKTWLLRRIALGLADAAWRDLDARRLRLNEVTLPIRVRLAELGRSHRSIDALLVEVVRAGAERGLALARDTARSTAEPSPAPGHARAEAAGVSPRLEAFVRDALRAGRVVVLLDAWDEVPGRQRPGLDERLRTFAAAFPKTRILLTSRDVGDADASMLKSGPGRGSEPAELELLALDPPQVHAFCTAWFGGAERARALQRVLDAHEPMRELARNPLMLTFMCRLAEDRRDRVPTRRVELYHRVVRGLLRDWQAEDQKPSSGRETSRRRSDAYVAAHLELLAPVAHTLFEARRLAEVGEDDLRDVVGRCQDALFKRKPRHELRAKTATPLIEAWMRDGLLVPTGGGDVLFLHCTCEEYLAGLALVPPDLVAAASTAASRRAALAAFAKALAARVPDPAWREVILLALGYVGVVKRRPDEAGAVIKQIVDRAPRKAGEAVALMGEAVAETAPDGVPADCRQGVVQALLSCMRDDGHVEPPERAACGDALARIGDPRFRADMWFLPDDRVCGFEADLLGFVKILKGPFTTGSDRRRDQDARDHEDPQHKVNLDYDYYIGRWPVTVVQFRAFVKATGYRTRASDDALRGVSNHPVVAVSWFDAKAYCDWLTQELRKQLDRDAAVPKGARKIPALLARCLRNGYVVTLPSEAEWEKAARLGPTTSLSLYQWGDAADSNRANYEETAIDDTIPVGCFAAETSPHGVEDLGAVNLLEWTRSKCIRTIRARNGRARKGISTAVRVLRGGARIVDLVRGDVLCARFGAPPDLRARDFGFRVVVSPFRC